MFLLSLFSTKLNFKAIKLYTVTLMALGFTEVGREPPSGTCWWAQGEATTTLAWSQDGHRLGIGTAEGSLWLWQPTGSATSSDGASTGRREEEMLSRLPSKHSGSLACAAWSNCGLVASGGPDSQVCCTCIVMKLCSRTCSQRRHFSPFNMSMYPGAVVARFSNVLFHGLNS